MNKQLISAALVLAATAIAAIGQSTAFTYQGRLDEVSGPANGSYDIRFQLFDAASSGASQGGPVTNAAVNVSGGLFTVTLDFGNQFPGADRWLEVAARTNGAGAFGVLSPRQLLTATPYAIRAANFSGTVSASQLTGAISSNNIGAGSITTVMLASGAVGSNQLASGAVTTTTLAEGAVTAAKMATVSNWFALTIPNPTQAVSDEFGNAVAGVGSDRVLIGAAYDDTGALDAGAAYLFSTNGTLLHTFTNPTPASSDLFGNAVAAVGNDRLLIGAVVAGAAYLFTTNGTLITTFPNPTPEILDEFGSSVAAVGGDRVLIGANGDGTGAANAGAAYLFSTNGTLLMTFTNPTPAVGDNFGYSVAAVGNDRLLIGAFRDDTGATDAGAAYLFSTNSTLLMTFTNPTSEGSDNFGYSVAAVGNDRVLIGAFRNDTGATDAGAAYLFSTNGSLLTTFINPTPAYNEQFGSSVAAVGSDRVLIGASSDDTGAPGAGAAYLFSTNGTLLMTFINPTPAFADNFGRSVGAVGSDGVLIGASRDDTGAQNAGAAYLFSVASYNPGLVSDQVAPRSITTASLEDGAVTATKIGGVLFDSQIPGLDASKITSGTWNSNLIPSLDASKIATGILDPNRLPNFDASRITTGSLNDARLSANVALLNRSLQTFTGTNIFNDNVGIGTAAPQQKLDVAGSVRIQVGPTTILVNPDGTVSISSSTNITFSTTGDINLSGRDVNIGATRNLSLTGTNSATLNSSGAMNVHASSVLDLQGSLINLN